MKCSFLDKYCEKMAFRMNKSYATAQDESEALHNRVLRFRLPDGFSTLLLLEQGELLVGEGEQDIIGPALCYWPVDQRPTLCLKAGARARILGLSDTIILDSIGARAESVHLRMLTEHPFFAPLQQPAPLEQIMALVHWFVTELTEAEIQSPMSLSAQLRLIFIGALRLHHPEKGDNGMEKTNILRQFRHLVELHYRAHWPVADYAQKLGIDYDRLHRTCKRETGRSPGELVHERLTAEAKVRLEKSGTPLKQIAADLGFPDATRFSHFFKRRTDMAPGAYRAIVSRPDGEDLIELRRGFSDWP
ncbi:MAG: hypothetical protein BM560_11655 [Roseobacter sp. MedPE-SWde]|nr:MAG: hypothetical protein BM560_11655 [Roseobacter sp. MedPE-SWde]